MTEPTDADRKHAAELIWGTLPRDQVEAVARALAEERERAHFCRCDAAADPHHHYRQVDTYENTP